MPGVGMKAPRPRISDLSSHTIRNPNMTQSHSSLLRQGLAAASRNIACALLAMCSLSVVSKASGEGAQRPRGVIIVVADSFPASRGYAVILRDVGPAVEDVVILPSRGAAPDALAGALVVLRKLRTQGVPSHTQIVTLTGLRPQVVPPRIAAWLNAVVQRVSQQPHTRIGNIGQGRWVELADITLGS